MLNRENLNTYIADTYGIKAEFPFVQTPLTAVYRHENNKKWFAVMMNLHKTKFGLAKEGFVDVVNLKSDPIIIGSLLKDDGIFPAYHMNKAYWISLFLDGSVEDEKIKWLLDISFELTAQKTKKKRGSYD